MRFTQVEAASFLTASSRYGQAHFNPQTGKIEVDGDWAESALREQCVLSLYKRLRKAATKISGGYRFGPEEPDENWFIDINLHDDEKDGAFFVALALLDPRSKMKVQVSAAEEVVWPVVEKIHRVKAMRKELKLDDTKPKRYEDDEDPKLKKVGDDSGSRCIADENSKAEVVKV